MYTPIRCALLLMVLLTAACSRQALLPTTSEHAGALDPLVFTGVLHCPDCDGLRVHLRLDRAEYIYQTREERLGDAHAAPRIATGLWQMVHGTEDNPDAIVYQLDYDHPAGARNFLRLDDQQLKLLDDNGREFWSPYNLILHRTQEEL